jgi:signal transduction histidine kinase/ligand-binding sensor domain-containing protein
MVAGSRKSARTSVVTVNSMLSKAARGIRRVLTVSVIVTVGVLTRTSLVSAGPTLAQMYHTRWTVREGLPRDVVDVTQTSDGFLWFATENGLYRFDGQSFDRYQPSSGNPFPGTQVSALLPTADGGLWIGYGRVGASFLKDGRNTNYGERAGFGLASIEHFAIDKEGTVWATVAYSGLKRLEGSVWKTVGKEWNYPTNSPPNWIFVDAGGTLWVGTHNSLLYLRKGERAFHSVPEVTWRVWGMAQAPNGILWIGSRDAPARALDPSSVKLRQDIPPIDIRTPTIIAARDGSLWFATLFDGVSRIESPEKLTGLEPADGGNTQHFTSQNGLTSNVCFTGLLDREGSTWIVTAKGLDQFRPAAMTPIPLPHDVEWPAVAVAGVGQIFIGAATVEVSTGRVLVAPPASVFGISSIYRDSNKSLWFGGRSGLWELSGQRFVARPVPNDLTTAYHVQAMVMDRSGGLWVSFSRQGVYRLFQNAWSHMVNLKAAPDNLNTTMTIDSRGRLWFGFAKADQVQVLDGDIVTSFGESDGINIGYTTTISEISGKVLIGGEFGLEVLRQGKFHRLRLAGEAPLSLVMGVLQQKNGDLWINQGSGIIRIDAAELKKALSNPDLPMRFTLFNDLDGVDEMSRAPSPLPTIIDAGDGMLYFVMQTTVLFMDTSQLSRNPFPPSVVIRSLSDGTAEYVNSPDAVLPANTDKVTIRFAASSLLIPQRVQFRYRLEGIDEAWQAGNAQRLALYSRLPPGHYTFRVAASNNDGIWNEVGASVGFTIPPSFVQSAAFKASCVALGLALLWLIYRIRLRQITTQVRRRLYERLEERARIARDLHDTFFQGVQGLLLRFNTGTALLKKDEPARVVFEDALEQSDRVMLEGRELMLDLRAESSDSTDLADELAIVGHDLKRTYPGNFRITVTGDPLPLHPIVFDELHRFGREALSNAFRHAHAKDIEVELDYRRNELRMRIRDNGIGIDVDVLSSGSRAGHWGLPGMRERAAKIDGHVDIWSRSSAGTEIELRVPAAAAYGSKRKHSRFGWLTALTMDGEDSVE